MKDLHTWLSKLPKKRKHEETVAAEEFEGDDIDERERRALKRSRKAEDEDPSYLGGVVPRNLDVEARKATRTKIAAPASTASRPARLALPTDPPVRPPRSAMDAPASAASAMPAVFQRQSVRTRVPCSVFGEQVQSEQSAADRKQISSSAWICRADSNLPQPIRPHHTVRIISRLNSRVSTRHNSFCS